MGYGTICMNLLTWGDIKYEISAVKLVYYAINVSYENGDVVRDVVRPARPFGFGFNRNSDPSCHIR